MFLSVARYRNIGFETRISKQISNLLLQQLRGVGILGTYILYENE